MIKLINEVLSGMKVSRLLLKELHNTETQEAEAHQGGSQWKEDGLVSTEEALLYGKTRG